VSPRRRRDIPGAPGYPRQRRIFPGGVPMNSKMYLPAACLIFCVTYIVVVDRPILFKMMLVLASAIFALLLVKAWIDGKKGKK